MGPRRRARGARSGGRAGPGGPAAPHASSPTRSSLRPPGPSAATRNGPAGRAVAQEPEGRTPEGPSKPHRGRRIPPPLRVADAQARSSASPVTVRRLPGGRDRSARPGGAGSAPFHSKARGGSSIGTRGRPGGGRNEASRTAARWPSAGHAAGHASPCHHASAGGSGSMDGKSRRRTAHGLHGLASRRRVRGAG